MEDLTFWWRTAVSVALTAAGWIGLRAAKRFDDLELSVSQLKSNAITKAEMRSDFNEQSTTILAAIKRVSDDFEKGQRDLIDRVLVVDSKAERANRRLDEAAQQEIERLRREVEHRGQP